MEVNSSPHPGRVFAGIDRRNLDDEKSAYFIGNGGSVVVVGMRDRDSRYRLWPL